MAQPGSGRVRRIRRSSTSLRLETEPTTVNVAVAGIDIGKSELMVCISAQLAAENVRRFGTVTAELQGLAGWLADCGIRDVAFEATGSYWKPLYRVLVDGGLRVTVFMPGALKSLRRPKTDVEDCQWIWRLHSQGLLRGSFVPADEVAQVRTYDRQKEELTGRAADAVRLMQKALTEMNIKLDVVLTDITGKSGLAMLEAILAGERDPRRLAELRDRRVKATAREVERALEGTYSAEHLFVLGQVLELWKVLRRQIGACVEQVLTVLGRLAEKRRQEIGEVRGEPTTATENKSSVDVRTATLLTQIYGTDVTALPGVGTDLAISLLGETGYDLSLWPSERHHAAWCRLSPQPRISGGKHLKGRDRKVLTPRVGRLFRQAAVAAAKTQTMVGARFRRLRKRLEGAKALKATAHALQTRFYRIVRERRSYQDIGADPYDAHFRERELQNLKRKAKRLGMQVVPAEKVA
jgi:transposase